MSSAGREILGQLQNNLSGSIQRLKAMPEHQRHGVNCPLYSQVLNFHDYVRQVPFRALSTASTDSRYRIQADERIVWSHISANLFNAPSHDFLRPSISIRTNIIFTLISIPSANHA